MADETDLTIRILREIQATLAEHTKEFASIKETLRLHGVRLDTHSAMFGDVRRAMEELRDMLRLAPSNATLARDLRALEGRVAALEAQRQ